MSMLERIALKTIAEHEKIKDLRDLSKDIFMLLQTDEEKLPLKLADWKGILASYRTRNYWPRFVELIQRNDPSKKSYDQYKLFIGAFVYWTTKNAVDHLFIEAIERETRQKFDDIDTAASALLEALFPLVHHEGRVQFAGKESNPEYWYRYFFSEDSSLYIYYFKDKKILRGLPQFQLYSIADRIYEECNKHLLFHYFLNSEERRWEKRKTTHRLLEHCLRIKREKEIQISVSSPLAMFLSRSIYDIDCHIISQNPGYSRTELIRSLGAIAENIDEDSQSNMFSSADIDALGSRVNPNVRRAIELDELQWIRPVGKRFKFSSKPDRFFFKALSRSLHYVTDKPSPSAAEAFVKNIMEYAENLYLLNTNRIHDQQPKRERFLLYSFFCVSNIFIPLYLKKEIINRLCIITENLSVSSRKRQIAATNLLLYILSESNDLEEPIVENILQHTFAMNYYHPYLFEEFDCIHRKYPSITMLAREALDKATCFESENSDSVSFTVGYPQYLSLAGRISFNDQFIDKCGALFAQTWPEPTEEYKPNQYWSEISSLLQTAMQNISRYLDSPQSSSSVMRYVYGAMLLGFSASTVISDFLESKNAESREKRHLSYMLLSTIIYADYLARKANRRYSRKTPQTEEYFYFLCGEYRVTTSYCFNFAQKVELSVTMRQDYLHWLQNEKDSRFEILLLRVLAYTNFFDVCEDEFSDQGKNYLDARIMDLKNDQIPPIQFMPHDKIIDFSFENREANLKYLQNPKELQY